MIRHDKTYASIQVVDGHITLDERRILLSDVTSVHLDTKASENFRKWLLALMGIMSINSLVVFALVVIALNGEALTEASWPVMPLVLFLGLTVVVATLVVGLQVFLASRRATYRLKITGNFGSIYAYETSDKHQADEMVDRLRNLISS